MVGKRCPDERSYIMIPKDISPTMTSSKIPAKYKTACTCGAEALYDHLPELRRV